MRNFFRKRSAPAPSPDDGWGAAVFHLLLVQMSVRAAATEAAGFAVIDGDGGPELRVVNHIRPDDSTAEIRQKAIDAFREFVHPCVTSGKNGAIIVAESPTEPLAQYCLVRLIRDQDRVRAAAALVCRCGSDDEALERLALVR